MNLSKNTLAEQIYQILRNDILTLAIPLGEKLTLKTMQERFGVSSTPIRDAFTRLTEDGLVNYYSNIGVSVIDLTRNDLIELYQFMGDLDSLAIRYSAAFPDQSQVHTALTRILTEAETLEKSLETGQHSTEEINHWINCSDQFHLIFYDFCGNGRLKRAAERQRSQLTIFSNMYESQPTTQKQIASWHKSIYNAYCQGQADLAARKMKDHLDESLTYALEALDQVR